MRRFALAATIILASSPALADVEEGRACETSMECGALHCIDGACVPVENGRVTRRSENSAMFGDGHGYVSTILVADVAALAGAGVLLGVAFGTSSGWPAVAAAFPPALTGPVIHAFYGRTGPAVISFFAWASVAPTTLAAALLGGGQSSFNTTVVIATGTVTGIVCALALTALDVYFARPIRATPRTSSISVMPSITPTHNGLSAAIIGAF